MNPNRRFRCVRTDGRTRINEIAPTVAPRLSDLPTVGANDASHFPRVNAVSATIEGDEISTILAALRYARPHLDAIDADRLTARLSRL